MKLTITFSENTSTHIKAFVVLIAIDTITKIIAFSFLPSGKPILPGAVVQLVLRVNSVGLGSSALKIMSFTYAQQSLVLAPIFCFGLGILLLVLSYWGKLSVWTVAICIGALIAVLIAISYVLPVINIIGVDDLVVALRVSQGFLWIVIWMLTSSALWKLGLLLWASAAGGNLLSLIYPPYRIVDFLWSEPLNRAIGYGVFNFADVLWLIAFPIFVLAILRSLMLTLKVQMGMTTGDKR